MKNNKHKININYILRMIGSSFLISMLLCSLGCSKKEAVQYQNEIIVERNYDGNSLVSEENTEKQENTEKVAATEENPIHEISLNKEWKYAEFSEINSGNAILYKSGNDRKNIIVGVNAGHGTKGGQSVKTYSHPDKTPKVTGGTNKEGAVESTAVSAGMTFKDGTEEAYVTLKVAQNLKEKLLNEGYDVLMLRDNEDVQLDNIARTVIANNVANCIVSIHFDGDTLDYDKGCFYISVPEGIKNMEPVASNWQQHEKLGKALVEGLKESGCKIYQDGKMVIDLTQTSFSTVPSVDIELGNQMSPHDEDYLNKLAEGLVLGVNRFY